MMRRTVPVLCATHKPVEERVAALEKEWATNPRWKNIKRHYSARDVVNLQGSQVPFDNYSRYASEKAFTNFANLKSKGDCSVTFGALDPTQVVQMAKWASTIYVSGWQCSSTASTSNEPGPDLADYPSNTVPQKVDQLVKAQRFHDRKQWQADGQKNEIDHLTPIIADADTGHGGLTAVMRLTKMFIEAGSAGMHLEDQRPGSKKCGHMGGKVLVATQEHVDRLQAARLQSDITGGSMLLVGRTDSEAGSLIDSNCDPRDHPFIKGRVNGNEDITYGEHVRRLLKDDAKKLAMWEEKEWSLGHEEAVAFAKDLGVAPGPWCWNACRSRDGFFSFHSCVQASIARANAFSPYADLLWMETAKPGVNQAKQFADGVKNKEKFLAYNLSPSFNWDKAGMSDAEIESFCKDLGKLGFVFQFITLAGFHGSGMVADLLAKEFIKNQNMLGYVKQIQRVERAEGVELLTHQKWSGATYIDTLLSTVRGTSDDIGILSSGNTEAQFK